MSESMSVDREWLHDLGVAEGIDHLQDPEIAAVRRDPFDGVACPGCGSEDLAPQGNLPRARCRDCGAVSNPNDTTDSTDASRWMDKIDVPDGSDTQRLIEKLESVSGWTLAEWLVDFEASENVQVWHVPVSLAESQHLPLHDPDLGTIMVGYPKRETGASVKFNRAVYVLSLQTTERHPSPGMGLNERILRFTNIDDWEAEVQSCVGVENRSYNWDWNYLMDSHMYWPFSEMRRIV